MRAVPRYSLSPLAQPPQPMMVILVAQNLSTMPGARKVTLDTKTNRLFVTSVERGPTPSPRTDGSRPQQGAPVPGAFTILAIGRRAAAP